MSTTLDQWLDDLNKKIEDGNTVQDSLIVLTTAIKKKLDETLGLTPAQTARMAEIFASVEKQKGETADAVIANTPSENPNPVEGAPVINDFSSDRTELSAGESAVLSYDVTDADTVTIEPGGYSSTELSADVEVTVDATTTYTLTATNSNGSTTKDVTVEVV